MVKEGVVQPILRIFVVMRIRVLLPLLVCITISKGQEPVANKFSKAIEDNSFFLEEAYNQEFRIVQHINGLQYSLNGSNDLSYFFSQEWPVFSQKHQLSYTVGFASLNSGHESGLNDFMINYRYQLTGHDDFVTITPRFSLIIPTGNKDKGLGMGVWGYQTNLALSKRVSDAFVSHVNIGATLLPNVEITDTADHTVLQHHYGFNLGASVIWLATEKTNLMLEVVYNSMRQANGMGEMYRFQTALLNPGVRHAFDLKNLQIVPGISVPITITKNDINAGVFFYLSLEHPF
jgi:hypothetical protein